jgi:hypothetical protein
VSSIVGVANVTGIESGAVGDVWATCGAASMVPRRRVQTRTTRDGRGRSRTCSPTRRRSRPR